MILVFPLHLLELTEQLFLLLGQPGRDHHADPDHLVATPVALQVGDPLAPQVENGAGLGGLGDFQAGLALQGRNLISSPRVAWTKEIGISQMMSFPWRLKNLWGLTRRPHRDPRRATPGAQLPLPAQAQGGAVVYAGRHGQLHLARLLHLAPSLAVRAGLLNHPALTAALVAGLNCFKTSKGDGLGNPHLAGALAPGAGNRFRPGAAPEPPQSSQSSQRLIPTPFSTPKAASSKPRSSSIRMSAPRRGPRRCC